MIFLEHQTEHPSYYITDDGDLDVSVRPNIFCFFPTSEKYGDICCITHAPFELVNSRQQLKQTEHNLILKTLLAQLAADALPILRDYYLNSKRNIFDGNILHIIPPRNDYYNDRVDSLFRQKYIQIIQNDKLLLSRERHYSSPSKLLMASDLSLANLISPEQLKDLEGEDIHFINAKIWGTANKDGNLRSLLTNSLGIETFDADYLLNDITPEFMETQSYDWVKRLYNHLHRKERDTWDCDDDLEGTPALTSPIIKISNGKWVSAYNQLGNLNVFFPLANADENANYQFVHEEYLREDITRNFLRNALHITQPDSWSYVESVIFRDCLSSKLTQQQLQSFFEFIYKYLRDIDNPEIRKEKLQQIRNSFVLLTKNNSTARLITGIYYDSAMLQSFMNGLSCVFVDSEKYSDFIKRYGKDQFNAFLIDLGVIFKPRIQTIRRNYERSAPYDIERKFNISNYTFTAIKYSDFYYPNIEVFAKNRRKDQTTSKSIWSWLSEETLSEYRYARCEYRYRVWHSTKPADSKLYTELRTLNWICLNDGKWTSPANTFIEDLEAAGYPINESVVKFLEIPKRERDLSQLGLTDEEIKRNRLGKMVEDSGLSMDELKDIIAKAKAEKAAKKVAASKPVSADNSMIESNESQKTASNSKSDSERKSAIERKREEWDKMSKAVNGRPATTQFGGGNKAMTTDIPDMRTEGNADEPFFDNAPSFQKQQSADDKGKRAMDKFKRKNTEAKNAAEKAEDANELLELFEASTPFSYLWFKLLMDLQFAEHKKSREREFDANFLKFEITNFGKGVILSNPSKDIPDWIENAASLDVFLCSPKKTDKLASSIIKCDGTSVQLAIDSVHASKFKDVLQVKIIARDSINHIDSLRQRFIQLGFEDDYNLNENLNGKIEFIYGPPGTGKTTRIVQKLSQIIADPNGYKNILVLTPTNKAADVIAAKLFDDVNCGDYLTRFGTTESQDLIEEAVVQARDTLYIDALDRNIVVSTIARYSYDCFQPDNCAICDFNWDMIVIDEASMVDIIPMVYTLYKSSGSAFIIAGDPKQIEPVNQNDMPSYNIYDMVGLNSFKEAITKYKRFPIEALTTQHRSIPEIGNLISQFAYDGLVKHNTKRVYSKALKIDGLSLQNINFVGFRTEEIDRLYELTAIGKSPFHLYSAILTYNFAHYLAQQIEKKYPSINYTIGIVTPYGAQADAITQMELHHPMSTSNCKVTAGTVHRFQGDECDIMLLLLNPPANPSEQSHVNNDNIINVAMSRARDYLFFMMPQGQIDGFNIKRRLRDLIPKKNMIAHHDLEKLIFGKSDYIECNTNVMCHLPVNVYSESMMKYEVRISDTALDIQVND